MTTFRQLRYLVALAEHRHFGRAADACAVSQPALSMQIRELEKQLGVELAERRPSDVLLTSIGRDVAERAAAILAAERDLVDFAHHRGRLLNGSLSFGVIPTIAPYLLPKILPMLQRHYPNLRVELRETQTKVLLEELVRGSLDVVMLALPVNEPELETLRLFDDPFLLAIPADDPQHEDARVTPADIDEGRLILLEEGHCLRDQALAYCRQERADGTLGLGATSLTTVMQMVANGFGVTLVPQIAADVEVRDERVKLVRFAAPEPGRTIGLVWRRTSPRKADFVALGKLLTEACAVPGHADHESAVVSEGDRPPSNAARQSCAVLRPAQSAAPRRPSHP
jgi:LysR family transcriptional regulator, hydrogen peroxide-inducible genes activator